MKLTKREQYMLAILVAVLTLAGMFFLLISPAVDRLEEKGTEISDLDLQKTNMELLLNNKNLDAGYEKQKAEAEKNYNSFYSTLNSYTIDSILNELMDDHSILVQDMQISSYESAFDQQEGSKQENLLLLCRVRLSGIGDHNNILAFLDALNDTSVCLQATTLSISDQKDITGKNFSCEVQIFGIRKPTETSLEEVKAQNAAKAAAAAESELELE